MSKKKKREMEMEMENNHKLNTYKTYRSFKYVAMKLKQMKR